MSGILIYTSIINRSVSMPTKEVLGMARAIARKTGDSVTAALVGADVSDLAQELIACGADQVCICEHVKLSEFCANLYLKALEAIVAKVAPRIVLIPGEATGTDIAPRLAQRIKGGLVTDCIEYEVRGDTVIFDDEQIALKELAQDFFVREVKPVAAEIDARPDPKDCYPAELINKASRLGLRTIGIPEEYGGGGADVVTKSLLLDAMTEIEPGTAKCLSQCWKVCQDRSKRAPAGRDNHVYRSGRSARYHLRTDT